MGMIEIATKRGKHTKNLEIKNPYYKYGVKVYFEEDSCMTNIQTGLTEKKKG